MCETAPSELKTLDTTKAKGYNTFFWRNRLTGGPGYVRSPQPHHDSTAGGCVLKVEHKPEIPATPLMTELQDIRDSINEQSRETKSEFQDIRNSIDQQSRETKVKLEHIRDSIKDLRYLGKWAAGVLVLVFATAFGTLIASLMLATTASTRLDQHILEVSARNGLNPTAAPVRMAVVSYKPIQSGSWDIARHVLDFDKFERQSFLFAGLETPAYDSHISEALGVAGLLDLKPVSFSEAKESLLETNEDVVIPSRVDADASFGFREYDPNYLLKLQKGFVELGAELVYSAKPIPLKGSVTWEELLSELEVNSGEYESAKRLRHKLGKPDPDPSDHPK